MIDEFVKTVKGFLMSPVEAFKQVQGKTVGAAFQYYALLLVIFTILFGIVNLIIGAMVLNSSVIQVSLIPVIGNLLSTNLAKFGTFLATAQLFFVYMVFLSLLFGVFVVGLFLHVFVLLMDGQKGLRETLKTTMFAATPALLLGWIPFINVIGGIWSFVLLILGFRENNGLSLEKSVIAALLPLVLWWILLILASVVISSFFGALAQIMPAIFH
jgi:hypothetical protein